MSKPILRVTQIEKYRRFINDVSSYDTEQSVIDTICGEFKGNSLTRIGTAFHTIVEKGLPYLGKPLSIDGHDVYLSKEQWYTALEYRDEHPGAFHEIRLYKDYGPAIVTGCADMIDGLEIRDIKTKYSTPSDSDYINSCQWRYYLELFGADVFHFDLFVFNGYNKDKHGYDVQELELTRHMPPITCYRYDGMEEDNQKLLNEFLVWLEYRDLLEYLPTTNIE